MAADAADESPRAFYDRLAPRYDAIYDDWWEGAQRHATVVARVLTACGVEPPARVLDCTCGIGTQAIPLARRGFVVSGTDISPAAVDRARTEAADRGIEADFAVADMRALPDTGTQFDAVIACDNSLAHLLDDDELDAALASVAGVLASRGVFLASVRDYDALRSEPPSGVPGVLRMRAGRREIVGQAWEWTDDLERIRIHLFILREGDADWRADVHTTWCRALTCATLDAALTRAGFVDVVWHEPAASGYYQPIVTARAGR